MMINWAAVEKWRDALRSGKYKQGKHVLKSQTNEYCCLGVFCEAVCGLVGQRASSHGGIIKKYYKYKGTDVALPKQACEILGIDINYQAIFKTAFCNLNDNKELTFDEIADLLDIALIDRDYIG